MKHTIEVNTSRTKWMITFNGSKEVVVEKPTSIEMSRHTGLEIEQYLKDNNITLNDTNITINGEPVARIKATHPTQK